MSPQRLAAPLQVLVRRGLLRPVLGGVVRTGARRALGRRNHPDWSWQLELLLDVLRRSCDQVSAWEPDEVRKLLLQMGPEPTLPEGVVEEVVEDAGVRGLRWRPRRGSPRLRVLHFHGGGYVLGRPELYRPLLGRVALAAGAEITSVRYRLVPEHPHSAALADARAAWEGVRSSGSTLPTVLCGDSAGGGLTLALLQQLRDAGAPTADAVLLLSPFVDPDATGATMQSNARRDFLTQAAILRFSRHLGAGAGRDPLLAPLRADLSGLPPILVQAGGAEIMLDGIERFAHRAREAGTPVELQVFDGLPHVPHFFAPLLPGAASPNEALVRWLEGVAG
jgi:monoterpene epsilon-lactone hydrolase